MVNSVILQAQRWDFICQQTDQDEWIIMPRFEQERWQLIQTQEHWILTIQGIPQITLDDMDTIAFLRLRRQELGMIS